MNNAAGFTILELMITLAIATLVMAIAVPSYRSIASSYNISAETNSLLGDVSYARNEAIRQGISVLMCSSSDGLTCSASSTWGNGWVVMVPANGSCTVTSGQAAQNAQPLRVQAALTSGDSISFAPSGSNSSQGLCFSRLGTGTTGSFTLTATGAASSPNQFNKQCLIVGAVGLPHVVPYGKSDALGSC